MALISVEPEELLLRVFSRRPEGEPVNSLLPKDFRRRMKGDKLDSGISLYRLKLIKLSEAVLRVAKNEDWLYGVAVASAKDLLSQKMFFTNLPIYHPAHAAMRCKDCNGNEFPSLCEVRTGQCPFAVKQIALQQNEVIRSLFQIKYPAEQRSILLKKLTRSGQNN